MTTMTTASSNNNNSAPRRCFVIDLPAICANTSERRMVRLMGTLVSIARIPAGSNGSNIHSDKDGNLNDNVVTTSQQLFMSDESDDKEEEFLLLHLDDGTGTIACMAPMAVVHRTMNHNSTATKKAAAEVFELGQMVDVIGEISRDPSAINCGSTTTLMMIMVETLLEVRHTPCAAERLRWFEIISSNNNGVAGLPDSSSCLTTTSQPPPSQQPAEIAWCGYPCPDITSNDILHVIESNRRQEGARLADLAVVLDLEEAHVQSLIEELQINGLIYENEKGFYVPL